MKEKYRVMFSFHWLFIVYRAHLHAQGEINFLYGCKKDINYVKLRKYSPIQTILCYVFVFHRKQLVIDLMQ